MTPAHGRPKPASIPEPLEGPSAVNGDRARSAAHEGRT
jgi:hypothetical protein